MLKRQRSFFQIPSKPSSSKSSSIILAIPLHDNSSGTMGRVQEPLLTRDNTITCTSPTTSSRQTTRCSPRLPTPQPPQPIDGREESADGSCEEIEVRYPSFLPHGTLAELASSSGQDDNGNSMKGTYPTDHNSRITQYLKELEIIDHLPLDRHNPCESLCPMCDSVNETDEGNSASAGPRSKERESLGLRDRLCNVAPRVVELRSVAEESGHEILYSYRKTPHTIVIDSHIPDIAPHIVITPPSDPLDAFPVAEGNRVNCQVPWNLVVPPMSLLTSRMPTYEEWTSMLQLLHSPDSHPPPPPGARRVFNRSAFDIQVNSSEEERLCPFTKELHWANHRRLFKITAVAAGLRATELRSLDSHTGTLWESTEEESARWTDPADRLLSAFGKCRDTHVIHSVDPRLAPHIVIQECGPNDPWTVWNNSTSYQDLDSGTTLSVIPPRRTLLTCPDAADNEAGEPIDMHWDHDDDLSSYDSSCPQTPSLQDEFGDVFLFEEDITECPTYQDYPDHSYVVPEDITSPKSKATFFILDEDEDDGPPEFDDWYLAIAKRAQEVHEDDDIITEQYS